MTDLPVPITLRERSAFLPESRTLVVADVHLGRGTEAPLEAPIDRAADTADRLSAAVDETGARTVVVAGDLLHSFSRTARVVEEALERLVADLERTGATLVVTPGNHDTQLESVLECPQPETHDTLEGVVIAHGHRRPDGEASLYVVGHEHPAIQVDGAKRPCVLYADDTYRGGAVLVLPAFSRLARGSLVRYLRHADDRSPLIADPGRFRPGVLDPDSGEPLWFPPLRECAHLL